MGFKRGTEASARAHRSWARTVDRDARTRPGREAAQAKLEAEVDPDHRMSPATRRKAIRNAQIARMKELSAKGVEARRKKAAARRRDGAP